MPRRSSLKLLFNIKQQDILKMASDNLQLYRQTVGSLLRPAKPPSLHPRMDDCIGLGDETAARDADKACDEGQEYIVHDGDVMLLKFNV